MRIFLFFIFFTNSLLASFESIMKSCDISPEESKKLEYFIENKLETFIKSGKNFILPHESLCHLPIEYDPKTQRTFIHTDVLFSFGFSKKVMKSILYKKERSEIVARCIAPLHDLHELRILQHLNGSKGIVEAKALFQKSDSVELLLKLYNAKSIRSVFKEKTHTFTFQEKKKITKDLMRGLFSLHKKGYIHRDLHSGNCLLNVRERKSGRIVSACLADFGRTRKEKACKDVSAQVLLRYRSPEAFLYKEIPIDYKACDLFSLGCVLYKLYFEKEPPWFSAHLPQHRDSKNRLDELLELHNGAQYKALQKRKKSAKEEFEYMIFRLVHKDPKRRGSASYWCKKLAHTR